MANSPTASDEEPDDSTALEGVKATKGVSLAIRDTAFALSLLLSEGTDADMTKTTIKVWHVYIPSNTCEYSIPPWSEGLLR